MRTIGLVVVAVLAIAALFLVGCMDWLEPKFESPVSHRLVSGQQLEMDYAAKERQSAIDDAREAAEAQRKSQDASAKAEAELIKLNAGNEAQAADIRLAAQEAGAKAAADYAAASSQRKADLQALRDQTDAGLASIERQRQANAALWSIAKPFASMVPGGGAAVSAIDVLLGGTSVAGVMATVAARRGKSKAQDALESEQDDHADTKSELAATQKAAGRVVDSIDALALKAPAVADALKEHKSLLDEYQGELGKNLVDALQKGQTPQLAPA